MDLLPRVRRLLVIGCLLAVGFVPLFFTNAQSPEGVEAQAAAVNEQIQKLKDEIAQLQGELNSTTAQKQTLQSAVKALDLQIQTLTKSISLTNTQIGQKDKEIKSLAGGILDTSAGIERSQSGMAETLRELQARDDEHLVTLFLSGGTLSSFFDQAVTLSALRSELGNKIENLSSLRTDLVDTKTSAESKRRELAGLQSRLAQQKQGLTVARSEQNKLLTDTKNKEGNYQSLIAQKQAEQARFESELFELATGLGSVDRGSIPAPARGILNWPLDSVYITQQFGRTAAAQRLYTSGSHDGVDFRAAVGTPVRAALSGMVLEVNHGAAPNCQYGKWVLVRHGNGLTTLYAHLSDISVSKGASVSTGSVLGYAGSTGYATGPHLHFTVYASQGISFKQYTCKSGKVVTVPIAPVNAYLNPLSYLPAL